MKQEMKTVFKLFDYENKGYITQDSLRALCEIIEEDIDEAMLTEMINDLDANGDGLVSEDDFVRMLRRTVSVLVDQGRKVVYCVEILEEGSLRKMIML